MGIEKKTSNQVELKALSDAEVSGLLGEVPQWTLKDRAIERAFKFKDFKESMGFVNKVAALAEAEDHHPDICISYNKVQLTLSTHKVNGLSNKDFILAVQIDRLTN